MRAWTGVAAARASWALLPEPRIVTAILSSWYVSCAILGAKLLHLPAYGWFAVLLIGGGLVAASACLAGQWWIERVGIILLVAAWSIRLSMILMVPPPTLWVQTTGLAGIAALLVTRVARIWGLPSDPRRGVR